MPAPSLNFLFKKNEYSALDSVQRRPDSVLFFLINVAFLLPCFFFTLHKLWNLGLTRLPFGRHVFVRTLTVELGAVTVL